MCFGSNLISLDLDRTANFGDPLLPEPAACLRLIRALAGNENLFEPLHKLNMERPAVEKRKRCGGMGDRA